MQDFKTCATLEATFRSDLEGSSTIAVLVMSFSTTAAAEASRNSSVCCQWCITANRNVVR